MIQVRVCGRISGKLQVLRGIDCDVRPQEVVVVIGKRFGEKHLLRC